MASIQSQHGLRSQNANRMLTLFRKICFDGKNFQSLVPTVETPRNPSKIKGFRRSERRRKALKMLQKTPVSNDSKSVCGQPHVGSNPTVSARAGSDVTLPAFLYRLLCTIFGTASEHTIHCICRSLLRIVIQVSVDVCCIRIGTMSQPYLDLFHCDIFTAVKQMPCPLSVQFFILVRIQSSSLLQQRKP